MIYLFHGDDVGASRQALLDLRKNYPADAVSVFEAQDLDSDELLRVLDTPAMFSEKRLIILEGKPPQSVVNNPQLSVSGSATLAFWVREPLKASDKLLKWVRERDGEIRQFRERVPQHVFGFLDALGYKKRQKAFLELHRLLERGESPVYLLTMIVWQIRNLIRAKLSLAQRPKGINPYVLRKAQSQSKNFGEEELVLIFKNLLAAEKMLKTTSKDPVLLLDQLAYTITRR
jgi:DNA polymerase III delta subunit